MGQTAKPTPAASEHDAIDDQVDDVTELCSGDARMAVRGLILGQQFIRGEIENAVSAGYVRRRLH